MDYQELIERLRDTNRHTFALWFEAADAIESLLAENERLNAELAKYRDAPVVAYLYLDTNGEECFGHPDGYWPEKYSTPLIVKPGENNDLLP